MDTKKCQWRQTPRKVWFKPFWLKFHIAKERPRPLAEKDQRLVAGLIPFPLYMYDPPCSVLTQACAALA